MELGVECVLNVGMNVLGSILAPFFWPTWAVCVYYCL